MHRVPEKYEHLFNWEWTAAIPAIISAVGAIGGGAMSGKGGKGGGSSGIERRQKAAFDVNFPNQQASAGITGDILATGGAGMQTPMVQKGVEHSMQANAATQRQTQDQFATQGIAGDPWANAILAQQRQMGDFGTSQIPTQFAQQWLGMSPQMSPFYIPQQSGGGGNNGANMAMFGSLFADAMRQGFGQPGGGQGSPATASVPYNS